MLQRSMIFMHAFLLAWMAVCAGGENASPHADAVTAALQDMPDAGESLWAKGEALAALPAEAAPAMEAAIAEAATDESIVLAHALLKHGFQRPATLGLVKVIGNADAPLARRIEAAALLGAEGGDYAAWHLRASLKAEGLPERLRVELAKSLWKLTHGKTAFDTLESLMNSAASDAARAESALALGRFGRFQAALPALKALAERPGGTGEAAATLLRLHDAWQADLTEAPGEGEAPFPARVIAEIIEKTRAFRATDEFPHAVSTELETLAKTAGPIGDEARMLLNISRKLQPRLEDKNFPAELIGEIATKLEDSYAPDETDEEEFDQLKVRTLANRAASAMLVSVDPFNDYLDEESLRDMEEQLSSSYGGIGAWVGMRDGRFTILTPMYDKPAFKAGLRSMDIVEKIDDIDIKDMKLNRIIKLLKGPPGTEVRVTIWRKGWKDTRGFTVVRDTIDIPSVITQTLPGNIGYVKLTAFNEGNALANPPVKGTADLLDEALHGFVKDEVKGIILDLTNNPGGLLQTAVDVCKKFLGPGKLIVYSQGKPGVYPRNNYYTRNESAIYNGPLVVMTNSGSASASEIVAGALRDHKRATLVGEKTFGKGSVQQLIPLATTRGLTRIKLTIAKYYLPNDECIHKKGILPDVEVQEPDPQWAEIDARLELRDNRDLDQWIEQHFKENEKGLREALAFDNYDPARYPGFNELQAALQKKYPKLEIIPETLRKELRFSLRNYLRNNLGEDLPVDLEENPILQHALVTIGDKIEGGLPALPVYEAMRKRLAEKAAEIAAAKPVEDAAAGLPGGEAK